MEIYFSSTTCSFYPSDLLDDYYLVGTTPSDLIKLNEEEISIYFCKPAPAGKMIGCVSGRPKWVDLPEKTQDELAASARAKRDVLIAGTDYLVIPDYPISTDLLAKVKVYRQALRDITIQVGFPYDIDWPINTLDEVMALSTSPPRIQSLRECRNTGGACSG